MKENTANQIKNMKEQTIGVEVEMYDISRKKAAEVAADFFGTGRYEETAARNGYYTWSAWDGEGREWKFQRDVSIRANRDSEQTELVTPILRYSDIETLQELLRKLRKAGAKSNPKHMCGVHIHIGKEGHTPQTLRNLANLMASHESLLIAAMRIDQSRIGRYCRTVNPNFLERLNKEKPKTMEQLADIWYEGNYASHGRDHHYNDSRYHCLYAEYKNYAEILLGKSVISVLSPKISQHNSLQSFEKCLQIRIIIPIRHVGSMHLPVHRLQRFAASFRISLRIYLCGFNGFMSKEVADVDQVFARFHKMHCL